MTCLTGRVRTYSISQVSVAFNLRETRRERVLYNREKAIKVAEKQKKLQEKIKELEKKELEEEIKTKGCPIKNAEKYFYEYLKKTKDARKEKYKRINSSALN